MLPLVEELIPCPDPWDVARKLSHLPHLLFLDSSERHVERGRYSYVMAEASYFAWQPTPDDCYEEPLFIPLSYESNIFESLEGLGNWPTHKAIEGLPPFQGGKTFLIGYDNNRVLEKLPRVRYRDLDPLYSSRGHYDWVVSFDHHQQRAWCIVHWRYKENERQVRNRLKNILSNIRNGNIHQEPHRPPQNRTPTRPMLRVDGQALPNGIESNLNREGFLSAIRRNASNTSAPATASRSTFRSGSLLHSPSIRSNSTAACVQVSPGSVLAVTSMPASFRSSPRRRSGS